MRFWDVSSGSIRFGAEDIRRVNTAALREQESLVTQETELFDDTIENNIRIAKRDATREEVEAACKKALSYTASPSYKSIKNILVTGSEKLASEATDTRTTHKARGITRGAGYYRR